MEGVDKFDGLVYISEVLFDLLEYLAVVGELGHQGLGLLGVELVEALQFLPFGDDLELAEMSRAYISFCILSTSFSSSFVSKSFSMSDMSCSLPPSFIN